MDLLRCLAKRIVRLIIAEVLLMAHTGYKIEYSYEYMEMVKYATKVQYADELAEWLKEKYQDNQPDLILSHSNPAIKFLLNHKNQVFIGSSVILHHMVKS